MPDNQLVHEIQGRKYVLVDIPFVEGMEKEAERHVEKHGLLYQGIKSVDRGSFFSKGLVIHTYFCPEENYIPFCKDKIY